MTLKEILKEEGIYYAGDFVELEVTGIWFRTNAHWDTEKIKKELEQ